ncbi:MAG: acyl carrier protein [Clostridiales bacterium]|nr:acyl carrier protein [Clostridiales bacterium]
MDKSDIARDLAAIVENYTEFDMGIIDPSTSLREELGLTSFDIIALLTEIEEVFSISIDDIDLLADIGTFGEAIDLVADLRVAE